MELALKATGLIWAGFVTAYVLSWACQYIWSWIDDSKIGELNWLAHEFRKRFSKWKHFGDDTFYTDNAWEHIQIRATHSRLKKNVDYLRRDLSAFDEVFTFIMFFPASFTANVYGKFMIVAMISPWVTLLTFHYWYVAFAVASCFAAAHSARFVRRLQKKLSAHINDKTKHKEQED